MTDERRGTSPAPHGGDDPLDREIRRLLAVEPSPAFEARVRARVAAEPTRNAWRAGRLRLTFGAAAAALVLAVSLFGPEPPTGVGAGPGTERAGGTAPPSSGAAARAVSLPGVPLGPNTPERTGGPAPPPSGVATRAVRDDPAAVGLPVVLVEPNATREPAFPRALETGFRGAAGPPRASGVPPGAPRFTRVVFSADERDVLRQLLDQARNRPVVVPVTADARTPVAASEPPAELVIPLIASEPRAELVIPLIASEPPAELVIPLITSEPRAEVVIPLITSEPRAEVVIPPIAIEPPLTVEPLNVALLDMGADQ